MSCLMWKWFFLGEPIRWIFTVAGQPFEDVRIESNDWPEWKQSKFCFLHWYLGFNRNATLKIIE